jgi:DHA1 family bicyclomycin/chloramphenicol resistance-like MFS transporter
MALNAVPGAVGAGSAVLGAAQFGLAALVSPLVSLGGDRSTVPAATPSTRRSPSAEPPPRQEQ